MDIALTTSRVGDQIPSRRANSGCHASPASTTVRLDGIRYSVSIVCINTKYESMDNGPQRIMTHRYYFGPMATFALGMVLTTPYCYCADSIIRATDYLILFVEWSTITLQVFLLVVCRHDTHMEPLQNKSLVDDKATFRSRSQSQLSVYEMTVIKSNWSMM